MSDYVIKCPMCDRIYNDKEQIPLNLTCGHTFCKQCLKNSYRDDAFLECRICRKNC